MRENRMLRQILPTVGILLVLMLTPLKAEGEPSAEEDTIDRQTQAISVKLDLLEARLKHFLKRNNSPSELEKFRKYIFLTTMGIKLDLSKLFQNHSKTSQKHEDDMPYIDADSSDRTYTLYKMCKRVVESNVCEQMEGNENKQEMTRLLRIADSLINIRTRFRIYAAIYDDMTKQQYNNIFNLYAFLNMLKFHFIYNSNTPQDVISEAKNIHDNISKTFKEIAVKELIEHILHNCPSTEIDTVLWRLATDMRATNEFNNIIEEAINATYTSVGPIPLLDRGLNVKVAQGVCQTAKSVFQRVKLNSELYDTTIIFKLVQLIAKSFNMTDAPLDELEPCFDIEQQLNPSVREIMFVSYSCIRNQLHKAFIIHGSADVQTNGLVFVDSDGNSDYSRWRFEANGLNRFWVQNKKTKEYLYTPDVADNQSNNIKVSSQQKKGTKSQWHFELIPDSKGLRIMDEEERYLYVTQELLENYDVVHQVAVWKGQGIPHGSTWSVTQC